MRNCQVGAENDIIRVFVMRNFYQTLPNMVDVNRIFLRIVFVLKSDFLGPMSLTVTIRVIRSNMLCNPRKNKQTHNVTFLI